MAKYNINQTFIEKTKERFVKKAEAIVIPRNKIDAANYKTSLALKQVKNLKSIIIVETIILIIMCIIAAVGVIN